MTEYRMVTYHVGRDAEITDAVFYQQGMTAVVERMMVTQSQQGYRNYMTEHYFRTEYSGLRHEYCGYWVPHGFLIRKLDGTIYRLYQEDVEAKCVWTGTGNIWERVKPKPTFIL